MHQLRWYQKEAVESVWAFLCRQKGNPLVVLPTGAGKSHVIAQLVYDAVTKHCGQIIVLQHRSELIKQNAEKINMLMPDINVGLYSAGLNSRETESPIIVAGIQSVYNRAFDFGQRNLCIIDESHLVPFNGEGMYRSFLSDLRTANPQLRAVGMTATPYRLDSGPLARPDSTFQKVCYSAPVQKLIAEGFLTNLVTTPADSTIDTSKLRVARGDFIASEVGTMFSAEDIVEPVCEEIVAKTKNRKSVLIFCSTIQHAEKVSNTITEMTGEECGVVTGNTTSLERLSLLNRFRTRQLRLLCNVEILTTGYDSPLIDCIVVLRATMSPGLFAQICGRGFRVAPAKKDCLILDFGENIKRHGPIDAIDYGRCKKTGAVTGEAPTKTCPNCGMKVLLAAQDCECGFVFPTQDRSHSMTSDEESDILSTPHTWRVESISYNRHDKQNAGPTDKPTMRVCYNVEPLDDDDGNLTGEQISEWVCIEHSGFAGSKADAWWHQRTNEALPDTVDEAVDLARRGVLLSANQITTTRQGRWWRITDTVFDERVEPVSLTEQSDVPFDDIPF